VQNYDPEITFRSRGGRGDRGSQVVWVPLLAYDRYIDDPELFSHIVDISEYYRDLEQGTLPAVSYIVPSGASEHPPGSIQAGQRFVRTLINSLMRSEAWGTSAFIWTYDDWGGWYDHVPPPVVDDFGYGFRVPALLVSPYAKRGYVDSTVHDYTSIMKLIEQNWGLDPVAERDANANSLIDALDFSQPARAPVLLDTERGTTARAEPNRLVIYAAYLLAALLAAALIGKATGHLERTIGVLRRRWEARRG
jgi:phospholipase C